MAPAGGGEYRGQVPGADVTAPGVEVVIRVIAADGQEQLYVREPPSQPYLVAVSEAPAEAGGEAPIESLEPAAGATAVGRHPALVARLRADAPAPEPGRVTATLDGMDVTSLLELEGNEIRLRPASALSPGAHEVVLTFLDARGGPESRASWPFQLRDWESVEEGSLGLGVSGTYEQATQKLLATDPWWRTSAEARLEGRVADGALRASDDFGVRFLKQGPGEPETGEADFELSSHLLSAQYAAGGAEGQFELGDLGIRETALTTGSSFARRGTQLHAALGGTRARFFAADSLPLFGFTNFTGLQEPDQLVVGGSLGHAFLGESLHVQATALGGRSFPLNPLPTKVLNPAIDPNDPFGKKPPLEAYNVGSSDGGLDAQTWSLAADTAFLDGKLRAEAETAWARRLLYAPNSADPVKDERGWQSDPAWRARLEGDFFGIRAGAEYLQVGANFASAANPTLISDRRDVLIDLETATGPALWSLLASRGHDDLRSESGVPRTSEWRLTPSVSLALPDLPAVTLSYLGSAQRVDGPIQGQPDRIVTQGVSLGVSYFTPLWFASVAPSYQSQVADDPHNRTSFESVTIAGGLTPASWLTISPSYTLIRSHDQTSDSVTESHVPTLTAHIELFPDVLAFDTQSSYSSTRDNRDTIDGAFISALAQLTLSLRRWSPGGVAPAIGLRTRYERAMDDFNPAFESRRWGVFLFVDLFAPFGLLPEPGFDRTRGAPFDGLGSYP
jgi:hypothetical protein